MINQVTIIGVGLIGGSLAQALKSKNLVQRVVGISQAKTIKQAQTAGLIDEGFSYQELAGGIAGADIIFLCTPIKRIIALIGEIAVHKTIMHKHVIITDVGSTKASIVAQAQKAPACSLNSKFVPVNVVSWIAKRDPPFSLTWMFAPNRCNS